MGAPKKPCGKCIFYRRTKVGFDFGNRSGQLKIVKPCPPAQFGSCVKNRWYVSAMMSGCDDWETCSDLSMQWGDR
jgi:hypothetical protein